MVCSEKESGPPLIISPSYRVREDLTDEDRNFLMESLKAHGLEAAQDWKKVVAGRKLWHFDRHEALWQTIL